MLQNIHFINITEHLQHNTHIPKKSCLLKTKAMQ